MRINANAYAHLQNQNSIKMKKETKIIAGVLAGAALGAAVALILASDKNEEMKDKVSNWFCDLIDASKDRIADVTDQVKDTISKVRA